MKYVVMYGSLMGGEFSFGMVATYGDFDSAKHCCLLNIAEDFGCGDIEGFMEECGLDYEVEHDTVNPVYKIGRYDGDSHDERYAVYKISDSMGMEAKK